MGELTKENTVYIHALKYDVDDTTSQACFYVDEIPEYDSQTVEESGIAKTEKKFLWQSQKWFVTIYDESELPHIAKKAPAIHKRTLKRRLKGAEEGNIFEVSEVFSVIPHQTEKDQQQQNVPDQRKLREFIWAPRDINIGEAYILVTYTENNGEGDSLINESALSKSFTASYAASHSILDDFEITYDEEGNNISQNSTEEEQPAGALARLTYISEKLLHVSRIPQQQQEQEEETYEVNPLNIRLQYEEPKVWVDPYEGNYGMEMSHFQVSERHGDSMESSLLQIKTRAGGYLSDFSCSFSDMRRLKRFRKHHEFERHKYNDIPSDAVVIDEIKVSNKGGRNLSSSSSEVHQHKLIDDDDEEFEDLSIEVENMIRGGGSAKPDVNSTKSSTPQPAVAAVDSEKLTLRHIKDETLYKELSIPVPQIKPSQSTPSSANKVDREIESKSTEKPIAPERTVTKPRKMDIFQSQNSGGDVNDSGYDDSDNSPNQPHHLQGQMSYHFDSDDNSNSDLEEMKKTITTTINNAKTVISAQPDDELVQPLPENRPSTTKPRKPSPSAIDQTFLPVRTTTVEVLSFDVTDDDVSNEHFHKENKRSKLPSSPQELILEDDISPSFKEIQTPHVDLDVLSQQDKNDPKDGKNTQLLQEKSQIPNTPESGKDKSASTNLDDKFPELTGVEVAVSDDEIEADEATTPITPEVSAKSDPVSLSIDDRDDDEKLPEYTTKPVVVSPTTDNEIIPETDEFSSETLHETSPKTTVVIPTSNDMISPEMNALSSKRELEELKNIHRDQRKDEPTSTNLDDKYTFPEHIGVEVAVSDDEIEADEATKPITPETPAKSDAASLSIDDTDDDEKFPEYTTKPVVGSPSNDDEIIPKADEYSSETPHETSPKRNVVIPTSNGLISPEINTLSSKSPHHDPELEELKNIHNDQQWKKQLIVNELPDDENIFRMPPKPPVRKSKQAPISDNNTPLSKSQQVLPVLLLPSLEQQTIDDSITAPTVNKNKSLSIRDKSQQIDETEIQPTIKENEKPIALDSLNDMDSISTDFLSDEASPKDKVRGGKTKNFEYVYSDYINGDHVIIQSPSDATIMETATSPTLRRNYLADTNKNNIDLFTDEESSPQPSVFQRNDDKAPIKTSFQTVLRPKLNGDNGNDYDNDKPAIKTSVRTVLRPRLESNDALSLPTDNNHDHADDVNDKKRLKSTVALQIKPKQRKVKDFLDDDFDGDETEPAEATNVSKIPTVNVEIPAENPDTSAENLNLNDGKAITKKKSFASKTKKFVLKKLRPKTSEDNLPSPTKEKDTLSIDSAETTDHLKQPKDKSSRKSSFKKIGASIRLRKQKDKTDPSAAKPEEADGTSSTKTGGFIGFEKLKYDDEELASITPISERLKQFSQQQQKQQDSNTLNYNKRHIPTGIEPEIKASFRRSRSFDSFLNTAGNGAELDFLSKYHQEDDSELRERRRRLAGYSYVSRSDIPSRVVKGREYTMEACARDMEKEISFVKQERKKRLGHASSKSMDFDQIDSSSPDPAKQRELDLLRNERRKKLSKHSNSMEVSIDVLAKVKVVKHVEIPDVFLDSRKTSSTSSDTGSAKSNGRVGKLTIPSAFSVSDLTGY